VKQTPKQEIIDMLDTMYDMETCPYGHFKFTNDGRKYRVAIKSKVWRLEVRIGQQWKKVVSRFYAAQDSMATLSYNIKLKGARRK
jgi:hypothetical protein